MESHGHFDDQAATEPMQRESFQGGPGYGHGYPPQQFQQPYGYGGPQFGPMWGGRSRFGGGGGYGRRGPHEIETKPFFLTSEFLGTLLAIVAVAITAATTHLGVRLTWILIAAMVAAYSISRGIAKSGTKSRSYDPREELFRGDGGGTHDRQREGVGAGS